MLILLFTFYPDMEPEQTSLYFITCYSIGYHKNLCFDTMRVKNLSLGRISS